MGSACGSSSSTRSVVLLFFILSLALGFLRRLVSASEPLLSLLFIPLLLLRQFLLFQLLYLAQEVVLYTHERSQGLVDLLTTYFPVIVCKSIKACIHIGRRFHHRCSKYSQGFLHVVLSQHLLKDCWRQASVSDGQEEIKHDDSILITDRCVCSNDIMMPLLSHIHPSADVCNLGPA